MYILNWQITIKVSYLQVNYDRNLKGGCKDNDKVKKHIILNWSLIDSTIIRQSIQKNVINIRRESSPNHKTYWLLEYEGKKQPIGPVLYHCRFQDRQGRIQATGIQASMEIDPEPIQQQVIFQR